jgi:hypothetical protein
MNRTGSETHFRPEVVSDVCRYQIFHHGFFGAFAAR